MMHRVQNESNLRFVSAKPLPSYGCYKLVFSWSLPSRWPVSHNILFRLLETVGSILNPGANSHFSGSSQYLPEYTAVLP
jgi:hypothetical protein